MDVPDVVTDHLPTAVVTSLLIAPFDIFPGEIIVLAQLGIDLLVHVVALFVGSVVIEAGWYQVVSEEGA